jgi:dihydrodipicolinate synthase/N-acetylneuraminate lyase
MRVYCGRTIEVMMNKTMRGIFAVLQTPFLADGELDEESLRREVAFDIRTGAHGLVFPVLGGEFQYLADHERRRLAEVVVGEVAGQVPVVIGVAAPVAVIAAEHARHAAQIGADAVIALPPYLSPGTPEEVLAYYRAIAQAAGRPVFVQNAGPGLSPALLARLLREVEHVHYIKEEMSPSAHNISALLGLAGEECWGVFGGALGRWMLSEMRRGACGFMPAAEVPDVYVQIWDAYQLGDEPRARAIFNRLLPLINLEMLLGMQVCKEVLLRRGVIRSAQMRTPGCIALDDGDRRELEAILADLPTLSQ